MRNSLVLLWVFSACTGSPLPDDSDPIEVIVGPEIEHTAPQPPFRDGDTLEFFAEAFDADGVEAMELFYRTAGDLPYRMVSMELTDEIYSAIVLGDEVEPPAFEYYLRATDASDFRVPSTFPAAGSEGPASLPIGVVPTEVPYSQPFDDTTTLFGIYEVGWVEYAVAFRGERWEVDEEAGRTGGAAVHGGGFFDMSPVDDWLVSPVLDFSSLETAEVRWAERGEQTQLATHSLWISTGDQDPEEGDFVKLLDLAPPPEGVWASAPVVDLTAYAGQSRIILGWRYEGADADLWAVDDIQIRAFAPDLQLIQVEAGAIQPGDTVGFTVTLENIGAATAGPVTLSGVALDPEASFVADADLGPMGPGELVTAVLPLEVGVAVADNTDLFLELSATDGVDTFSWSTSVLVGDPTVGLVRLHTTAPGLVQVVIGTGNPIQPHAEEVVFLGNLPADVHSFSVDLGEHIEYLPSEPGRLRWWVRLYTDAPSSLLGFGIDFDGEVTWTDTVGAFPEDEEVYIYLPGRADPFVQSASTTPSPLVPGEAAVLELTLRNRGGFSTGDTEVRFTSGHPDLQLGVDVLPISVGPWGPDEVITLEVPVTIAAGHTDSTELPLDLTLWDPLEFYPLEIAVPVPWPDLVVGTATVLDPAGNGDGLLDPGEEVNLQLQVRNDGALPTGAVSCTLSQQSGPSLTLLTSSLPLGSLDIGAVSTASFGVRADNGAVGEELILLVACTDGLVSSEVSVDLVLGQRGWTPLPLDAAGDALPGAVVDIRELRWRVDGPNLEIEVTSAIPFDPALLALELWMDNVGSIWQEHVVTVQGDVAGLWGLQFGGFNALGDATVIVVDTDTVRIRIALAQMELADDLLQLAVGTGFCPTPELYCDHSPDGWGNPYSGPFDPSTWHTLDW